MTFDASGGKMTRSVRRWWNAVGWVALLMSAASPVGAFDLGQAQRFRLDNGLTLIVLEVPEAPAVSVQALYRVGARNEEVGRTG